jgi:hypothetical protein
MATGAKPPMMPDDEKVSLAKIASAINDLTSEMRVIQKELHAAVQVLHKIADRPR